MNLAMLLEMAADGFGDRVAIGELDHGLTYRRLLDHARSAASLFQQHGAERVVVVDVNSEAVPVALFGAALAGVAFVPVNYRLADDRLRDVLARTAPAIAIAGPDAVDRVKGVAGLTVIRRVDFLDAVEKEPPAEAGFTDPDYIAVLLYTSGTTRDPKAAVLLHRHLTAYVISAAEFMG